MTGVSLYDLLLFQSRPNRLFTTVAALRMQCPEMTTPEFIAALEQLAKDKPIIFSRVGLGGEWWLKHAGSWHPIKAQLRERYGTVAAGKRVMLDLIAHGWSGKYQYWVSPPNGVMYSETNQAIARYLEAQPKNPLP